MAKIILFRYSVRHKRLSNIQLKELAKYFFTLSSLGVGSVLVKFFESEKFALDRNALFGIVLVLLAALFFVYIAVNLLGKVSER